MRTEIKEGEKGKFSQMHLGERPWAKPTTSKTPTKLFHAQRREVIPANSRLDGNRPRVRRITLGQTEK